MTAAGRLLATLPALAAACSSPRTGDAATARAPESAVAATRLPDSLALRFPDGTTVWYTAARSDSGADGRRCTARTLEIRRGGSRIGVPLLYTEDRPVAAGDTTFEARVWRDCAPGRRYRVSLRTGQPVPADR